MASENMTIVALVDDDDIFQMITAKTISSLHKTKQILQFMAGGDALNYIQTHMAEKEMLPDVILLDLNMPVIDGWMFLEEFAKVKERLAKVAKIYIITSSVDFNDMAKAKKIPDVQEYIVKPVTISKLQSVL